MPLNINDLRELLLALDQTHITELSLKGEDFELSVRRDLGEQLVPVPRLIGQGSGASDLMIAAPAVSQAASVVEVAPETKSTSVPIVSAGSPSPLEKKLVEITSPMVGTFYRSPAPGESPFVNVGDRIRTGQTVCIIEAMKLMNELEAEVTGEIVEILAQNGEPVEYGQALMRVNPN